MITSNNKLIILTGVSAVGKSTFAEILKKKHNFKGSTSYCTRLPRENEKNSLHYHFISKNDFENKIKDGFFLEYDKIFDNYYGTSKKDLEETLSSHNIVMTLSIEGFLALKKHFKHNLIGVYLMPPNKEELKKRLNLRNSSEKEIEKRLLNIYEQSAKESVFFDKVLAPDTVDNTVNNILQLII
ncbi:AAA family ATPase [Alphaproteobacteria bacterium endosymbiont of Tiliacea citrago]|uniref:AAA family ATPase n=1 Tax=Alphaproteobacteria bacterium endosymbiont of Tiliacea citrago TaxID=3077944 RepID=UPI00313E508C